MKTYKYMEVAAFNASLLIELRSFDDFSRFLDHHQYRQLFLLMNEENKPTHFAVLHQGALLKQSTLGYHTLEDHHASVKLEYPSATAYYEAQALGCKNYKEYLATQETGTSDAKIVGKIRAAGFIDGFIEFAEMKKTTALAANIPATNASQLYDWAMAGNFSSFSELKDALQKGFTEACDYRVAMEKGFTNAADFQQAMQGNFADVEEWKLANKINARDREDLSRHYELEMLGLPELKHDERSFIVLLSKLPQNKKISANKLNELYQQQLETYRYVDTNLLPEWFTSGFSETSTLADFLQKNEEARKYGSYDKDGEYFETRRLQERKVVIDGSNVAFNSQQRIDKKPSLANIIRMVEALKEKGFTEITVMSDASLSHRIQDPEKMPALQQLATYIQTPAEKTADVYMIDYVKVHRCLLVSNDVFRDWKLNDAWVAENIDYYRLSFVMSDDAVLLPDVDTEK